MGRSKLLELLQVHTPYDANEELALQKIIEFVSAEPDCFLRELLKGHITASAWLLDHQREHALLIHHAKLDIWCQVGGHCDGDSDVLRVAIKEAEEESGLVDIKPLQSQIFDVDVHLIPECRSVPEHYHYDVRFLLGTCSDKPVQINHESVAMRWVSKNETVLPSNCPSLIRMHNKWREEVYA